MDMVFSDIGKQLAEKFSISAVAECWGSFRPIWVFIIIPLDLNPEENSKKGKQPDNRRVLGKEPGPAPMLWEKFF
jgi:hypothetical protein